MTRHRTFTQKVGAAFAIAVLLTTGVGAVGVYLLHNATVNAQNISADQERIRQTSTLQVAAEAKGSAGRGYLLTGDQDYIEQLGQTRTTFARTIERLRTGAASADERSMLDTIVQAESEHQRVLDRAIALRQSGAAVGAVAANFQSDAVPKRAALDESIVSLVDLQATAARQAAADVARSARTATIVLIGLTLLAAIGVVLVAVVLTRALGRQVGAAVGQVQVSSAELEAAAGQQANGAREEATAMSEITTTISELLVTSRQISDSSQRVASIAEETAGAARSGESTIEGANVSIGVVRRQIDLVVHHMLELGQKSQHIAAVLEIVSEHAEQTNILAINATIEATGAGESGKRFAVVADEIRKLADRVAVSAKEIRDLITDVRSAVNTTVMATETGSKAIDAGSSQFGDVAASFKHIAGLVANTTEAAREIELSTKQQTTAVEQVNVAVADVAQASRAAEASSSRTRQTASQLAYQSKDLLGLVRAKVAA
jgi:CHASE3 domain sensor protein